MEAIIMQKFLLAKNPMRDLKGGLAIIKTTAPIGMFEVLEGHNFFDTGNTRLLYRHYTYQDEEYTLTVHYYGGWKGSKPKQEEAVKQAFSDMDEAWLWFVKYMKLEDNKE